MSLWGMNEGSNLTGDGDFTSGANTFTSNNPATVWDSELNVGDCVIGADGKYYRITAQTANGAATLDRNYEGSSAADQTVVRVQLPRDIKITQDDGTGHTISSLGVYGIANSEIGVTDKVIHIAVGDGGTGYDSGTDSITVSGGGGTSQATATFANNGTGVITSVTVTGNGDGYTSVPSVAVSGGTGASLTAVLAGGITHGGWVKATFPSGEKAGTVKWETLVAASSITGDSEDIVTPDS